MKHRILVSFACVVGIASVLGVRPSGAHPRSAAAPAPNAVAAPPSATTLLSPGFEHGAIPLAEPSLLGPGVTEFVRLDPAVVHFEVHAAALEDGAPRVASMWGSMAKASRAVAVINSSMFQADGLTSAAHFEVGGAVGNKRWAAEQNSVFVADPTAAGPNAALVDLGCTKNRSALLAPWQTRVQSIRLLGCDGRVVWAPEDRAWSSALVGQDDHGRILFLHTRAPYPMNQLARLLHDSELHVERIHYTEGGPEASLYVRGAGVERRLVGSYETGFKDNDNNQEEWALPNVIVATAP